MLIFKKAGLSVLFMSLFSAFCLAQDRIAPTDNPYAEIFELTKAKYGTDQQLFNGVYFEDTYRNATGHPYFSDDRFMEADLVYNRKAYHGVQLKYDLYQQQVLIHQDGPGQGLTTVLKEEFLGAFSFAGMEFRRVVTDEGDQNIYQLVAGQGELQCYRFWFRERYEKFSDQNTILYSFSENKARTFLMIDGVLQQYKSNWSFVRIFPDDIRSDIRAFLRSEDIKMNRATDEIITHVVAYCQERLDKRKI
ncbi:MAG: hypothetical protein K9G38_02215 [Bacteroidales bacterium]|nr:hypothetical protein [Bacteroidales bacterium]